MNGTLALKEGVPLGDAMGELVDSETLAFEDKLIEMLLEGLVTNFTLFCGVFTINHQCKKVRFQQTHNQSLRQLLLSVSWDLHA